jgi:hypothetical protein
MRALLLAVCCLCAAPSWAADEPAPLPGPLDGARWVTYYGNPLSKRMGILGEIDSKEMMDRLEKQAEEWRRADPDTKVVPALELVAVVASDKPGQGGVYRTRMPDAVIEKVLGWARSRGWPVILDVQVGHSTVRQEVEFLRKYLEMPDVHLALDPEFDMPRGRVPGRRIGTSDAEDVNVAIIMLADMVEKKKLPPKLLLVHRFTEEMLMRYELVRLDPRVQVSIIMDGFGSPALKRKIYRVIVKREPVQFGGFKLFYKNDKPLMKPSEVLEMDPKPAVIIYQ